MKEKDIKIDSNFPIKIDNKIKTDIAAIQNKAVAILDPLKKYLHEISKYRLLTREEEIELGKRIQENGDEEAA